MIIILFICNIILTHSYVLRDAYNLFVKDGDDYKIDLVINEDYEMIDKKQLKKFHVAKDKFKALDKIARKESQKKQKITTPLNNIAGLNYKARYYTNMLWKSILHRDAELRGSVTNPNDGVKTHFRKKLTPHAIKKRELKKETDSDYNYSDLINEYYDQSDNGTLSQNFSETQEYGIINTLKRIFFLQYEAINCKSSIGLYSIRCLVYDYNNGRQTIKEIVTRVWNIARIWFLVYLVVAVPLWCTRGWCCCCLCCKFFKPRQTIDEAKKYLVLNPPGVFKTKNGEVHYNPTERERDSYEEFEHFIKAL